MRRNLCAVIVDPDAREIAEAAIQSAALSSFRLKAFNEDARRDYPHADALCYDRFDENSLHIICLEAGDVVAATRIVRACDGALPFSLQVPQLAVQNDDFELGRFIARPGARRYAFLYLLIGIAHVVSNSRMMFRSRIFLDVILHKPRTLCRDKFFGFGFVSTNTFYRDFRYDAECEIFVLEQSGIDACLERVWRYMKSARIAPLEPRRASSEEEGKP